MNVRWPAIGLLAVISVVAVSFGARVPKAATSAPLPSARLAVGERAPDVTVTTNHGPFALATARAPVLLEIFATWCPHCQRETAVLEDLAARYAGSVQIVAVTGSPYAVDGTTSESERDVAAFVARYGVTYDVAFDPTLEVARHYISTGFPTLTLIGTDHRVVWRAHGEVPEATIGRQFDALLAAARLRPRGAAPAATKSGPS